MTTQKRPERPKRRKFQKRVHSFGRFSVTFFLSQCYSVLGRKIFENKIKCRNNIRRHAASILQLRSAISLSYGFLFANKFSRYPTESKISRKSPHSRSAFNNLPTDSNSQKAFLLSSSLQAEVRPTLRERIGSEMVQRIRRKEKKQGASRFPKVNVGTHQRISILAFFRLVSSLSGLFI